MANPEQTGGKPSLVLGLETSCDETAAAIVLREADGASWCEWKGAASYYDLVGGDRVARRAAWTYLTPTPGFTAIRGAVAVMPGLVDRCTVDGETVRPQAGGFYGGWVTDRVEGPFKGEPGTLGW